MIISNEIHSLGANINLIFYVFRLCSMSPRGLKQTCSLSKLSIISLSSVDTNDNQYYHNTNNNKSYLTEKQPSKSFTQTLDQAVEYFEQILNQCAANDQQERRNVLTSSKRDRDNGLRSINRKPKINCRKWCEEQNRQMAKYDYLIESSHSRNQRLVGSTFFGRKALLQKPNGTTYICIRKRLS
jgi:hypothetical protein